MCEKLTGSSRHNRLRPAEPVAAAQPVELLTVFSSFPAICFRAGGSLPVICSYYAEFQPMYRRGRMICFLLSFWMVGSVLAAGIGNTIIIYLFICSQKFDLLCKIAFYIGTIIDVFLFFF